MDNRRWSSEERAKMTKYADLLVRLWLNPHVDEAPKKWKRDKTMRPNAKWYHKLIATLFGITDLLVFVILLISIVGWAVLAIVSRIWDEPGLWATYMSYLDDRGITFFRQDTFNDLITKAEWDYEHPDNRWVDRETKSIVLNLSNEQATYLAITKAQGETVDATQLGVSQELLFNVTRALVGGNGKYDMEQAKSRYGSVVQYSQLKSAVKSLTSSIQLGNNQEGGQGGKYTLTLTYKHPTDHFMRTSAMQYILRGDTGLESAVELFGRDPKPDSKSTYFNHRVSTGQLIGYFEESVTATIQPC